MTAIMWVAVAILLFLLVMKWVTPVAHFIYQVTMRAKQGLSSAVSFCQRAALFCAKDAAKTVEGTAVWVRVVYLIGTLTLFVCELCSLFLVFPVFFRIATKLLPPIPLEWAAPVAFFVSGPLLMFHLTEFVGALPSHWHVFPPTFAKGYRIAGALLTGAAAAVWLAALVLLYLVRQYDLDRVKNPIPHELIVVFQAIPPFVEILFGVVALLAGLAALWAFIECLGVIISGVAMIILWIPKETFEAIAALIKYLNPKATLPARDVVPLGPLVIDEDTVAITLAITSLGVGLSSQQPQIKERKVKTGKYVVIQEVGHANFEMVAAAVNGAAPVTLGYTSLDELQQPHDKTGLSRFADFSPDDEQYKKAMRASDRKERLRKLQIAAGWNARKLLAKLASPAPLFFTVVAEDDALDMTMGFSQLARDIPHLTHVVVTYPTPLMLATETIDILHMKAEDLSKAGNLDLVILIQPNSPLEAAKEGMQQKAVQGLINTLSLARCTDTLAKLKQFALVWTLGFDTSPVPIGRALEPHKHGLYELRRRAFHRNGGQHGYPNDDEVENQVAQLFERVVEDRNTHALDVSANSSMPLLFVVLLPYEPGDPAFTKMADRLQQRLKQEYPFSIPVFLPGRGVTDSDQESYYASVWSLFPVVPTSFLLPPAHP